MGREMFLAYILRVERHDNIAREGVDANVRARDRLFPCVDATEYIIVLGIASQLSSLGSKHRELRR